MSKVLVYSERPELARDLIGAALELQNASVIAVALGSSAAEDAAALIAAGAHSCLIVSNSTLDSLRPEAIAFALAELASNQGAQTVLVASTRRGRGFAPRLAQHLDAGCVTDAQSIEFADDGLRCTRFALGGATVKQELIVTENRVVALLCGGNSRPAADPNPDAQVLEIALELPTRGAQAVERRAKSGSAAGLATAKRVVCVGRGVEDQEDLELIGDLLKALGAELAGTRPMCAERAWIGEERMIGISGLSLAPDLYIGVGVSGQVQHLASLNSANVIVGINTDSEAPIFSACDFGVVGDFREVIPMLLRELRAQNDER